MKLLPLLLGLTATTFLARCGDSEEEAPAPPPMPVSFANPVKETVELKRVFTGRFTAVERVQVRARVSGYIDSVHFTEGEKIEKGDLLVKIDPRIFDAEVARTEAQEEQARTALQLAQQNYDRASSLIERNAISREQLDIRNSELASANAAIRVAEALAEEARLNRSFADITAPISGIAGRYEITPGNYITGGNAGANLLTTIVPHTPIYCTFDVDEQQVLRFTRMFFSGKTEGRGGEGPKVEIAVSDSDDFTFEGRINFAENELDESTATLQLRAIIENEDAFLTPGLFGRVRVPIGAPADEILVREDSLGFDQSKRFAWVLKEDNTVERRYVEVGELLTDMRVIKSGLTEQDQMAVSKISLLRPGVPLEPSIVSMRAEESSPSE